jgi:hypothetical protein
MHAFVCMYIYTYVHSHFDEMYMQWTCVCMLCM